MKQHDIYFFCPGVLVNKKAKGYTNKYFKHDTIDHRRVYIQHKATSSQIAKVG
jgi:hypothetical protein